MAASGDPALKISWAISSGLGLSGSGVIECDTVVAEEVVDIVESREAVRGRKRASVRVRLDLVLTLGMSEGIRGSESVLLSVGASGAEMLRIWCCGSALGVPKGLLLVPFVPATCSLLSCRSSATGRSASPVKDRDVDWLRAGLSRGDLGEYEFPLPALDDPGDPRSLGLACTNFSVMGEDICETCSGLGAGLRCAERSFERDESERGGTGKLTVCMFPELMPW
jgi:hypothetical protein